MTDPLTIIQGDALSSLRTLPDESVQCCVTSPPYWGLRDYGIDPIVWDETIGCEHNFIETRQYQDSPIRSGSEGVGFNDAGTTKSQRWRTHGTCSICCAWRGSLGLEPSPELYVAHLVEIFREVKRALRVRSHEYIFLLSKSERYYYNAEAIAEPTQQIERPNFDGKRGLLPKGSYQGVDRCGNRKRDLTPRNDGQRWNENNGRGFKTKGKWSAEDPQSSGRRIVENVALARAEGGAHDSPFGDTRNKRSVWTITTQAYPDAHFATFPTEIPRICILAGSKPSDTVIDCFAGSGTTAKVAIELGRKAIAIEPKAEYVEMIKKRCQTTIGLPLPI